MLWIRIRTDFGQLDPDSDPWAKITHKNRKKWRNFMIWLLGKNIQKFFITCKIYIFLVIKTVDQDPELDPDSQRPKMLDQDPELDPNPHRPKMLDPDPHWYQCGSTTLLNEKSTVPRGRCLDMFCQFSHFCFWITYRYIMWWGIHTIIRIRIRVPIYTMTRVKYR